MEIALPCSAEFARELARFEPCGEGNPRPVFTSQIGRGAFSRMGGGAHIKESVSEECELVQFFAGEKLQWYNCSAVKKLAFHIDYSVFNNRERASLNVMESYPVQAPPGQLLLASYLAMSAGGEEQPLLQMDRIGGEELEGLKGDGVCLLIASKEGAERAERVNEGFISAFGRPYTPCPYDTILYAPARGADLAGYKHIVFAEKPLSDGVAGGLSRRTERVRSDVRRAGGDIQGGARRAAHKDGRRRGGAVQCGRKSLGLGKISLLHIYLCRFRYYNI